MIFLQNFLSVLIASLFIGISFAYVFSLEYFLTSFVSFATLFVSFIVSYFFSEKKFIKFKISIYISGMLFSLIFVLFKIPFFPFLSIQEIYYYSRGRKLFETKISSKEVGKIASIFLTLLLFFSVIGVITKNFLLIILPSILILSFLMPYPNSFGAAIFFSNPFYFSFLVVTSIVFIILGFFI